ncbi:hypothetical protein D3C77_591680 [compost metagenome]
MGAAAANEQLLSVGLRALQRLADAACRQFQQRRLNIFCRQRPAGQVVFQPRQVEQFTSGAFGALPSKKLVIQHCSQQAGIDVAAFCPGAVSVE